VLTFRREPGKPSPGFTVRVGGLNVPAKRIEPMPAARLADLVARVLERRARHRLRFLLDGDQLIARHSATAT
jgi:hypothetical protein